MRGRLVGSLVLFTFVAGAGLGCGAGGGKSTPDAGTAGAPETLELFTWWVAPGEVEALRALENVYEAAYPMERVNQFTDANSANWQSMLTKGIDAHSWDVAQISAAGLPVFMASRPQALSPVDAIYEEPSLKASVIPDILAATQVEGHAMGVVTGVHRNNAFIFNIQILKDHQLAPPTTIPELLDVCAALKAANVTPIASALDAWIMRFLYLDLLSGTVGAADFGAFIRHTLPVSDPKMQAGIKAATDVFVQLYTQYIDVAAAKAPGYDWTKASDAIHDGKAAMIFLGDWVKGYLVHLGWDPGVDFGVSGPPGASDLFVYGADTFALPTFAPHPSDAHDFLTIVASKEAQVAFNRQKGSTPMRTDVRDLLDPPGRQNLDDLVNANVRLPGIDSAQWDAAMAAYVASGDKDALLQSLLTISPP
jgi:glucose/mannose transport system substrate-binding protein